MTSNNTSIAVDLMGGDLGPRSVLLAVEKVIQTQESSDSLSLKFFLFGTSEIRALFDAVFPKNFDSRVSFQTAQDLILQTDSIGHALKNGRNSSMAMALDAVKQGKANCCVSLGNTGAYVGLSKSILGMQANVARPVICRQFPSVKESSSTWLLDLGANVDCSAEQLMSFAHLANSMAIDIGIAKPKIALLNIGNEETKGNAEVRGAHTLLQASELNYQGFVEADQLYFTDANIVVCDGFVGNSVLKASEGTARFLLSTLSGISKSEKNQLLHFHPANYNGAQFLGLNGLAIKSHGGADIDGISSALRLAIKLVTKKNKP